jgi:pimeloyl-ACP methyl ester carboxylesterase
VLVPIGAGVSLDVADAGQGPAVVLLHGWPVTSLHWRHLAPVLNRAGYRTVGVEARGLGERSTGHGDLSQARLAAEVTATLDALGVRRFAVVGHAAGGTIATLLAAAQPGRVVALVVEEAVLPGTQAGQPPAARAAAAEWLEPLALAPGGLAEGLLRGRLDLVVDAFLTTSAGPAGLEFDAHLEYVAAHGRDDRLADALGLLRTRADDAAAVHRAARRRLRVPTLAIGGRFAAGAAVQESLARVASGPRSVVLPDAGAYPAEQYPDPVATAVIQFLRAV